MWRGARATLQEVVRVCKLAVAYRQRFHNDVVIDLVGYRRHGHNEQDDPTLTQPCAYRAIATHPTCLTLYAERLMRECVVSPKEYADWQAEATQRWQRALEAKQDSKQAIAQWMLSTWAVRAHCAPV
jgi:2-oxoglutarate dehydrogenase E1 component